MHTPIILIEYGAPHVVDELPIFKPDRLSVIARSWEHQHAFDRTSEYRPTVRNIPSFGILSKLLAYTVYNPKVDLDFEWAAAAPYDPKRIVSLVRKGLKRDDDIIQQWFGGNDVIKLLKAADTFDKMVLAVKCVCGEHEVSAEAKRYVEAVL